MEFPDQPIVLVEGKFDGVHFRDALARHPSLRPRWKLVVMSELDPAYKPGGSALATYLSANRAVINSRPLSAPVIVLRDWEDAGGNLANFTSALQGHASSTVLCCPASLSNPQLGASFRGVERYLPTSLIRSVIPSTRLTRPGDVDYPVELSSAGKDAYPSYKSKLAQQVQNGAPTGSQMRDLVEWLDQQIVSILSNVPAQLFL
jgi:hypothetical protein